MPSQNYMFCKKGLLRSFDRSLAGVRPALDRRFGDGQSFDYGVDYFECAGCKLLKAENAFELAPYICAVDQAASELLGWGLGRTMTLAEGFSKCDFRFKQGGPTHVCLLQGPYRGASRAGVYVDQAVLLWE